MLFGLQLRRSLKGWEGDAFFCTPNLMDGSQLYFESP